MANKLATTVADAANQVADDASAGADAALRSTQRFVNEAQQMARRGMTAVKDSSVELREKAQRTQDSTVGYIKDEPMKSVLIAAATGAVLMGLLAMFARSRSYD